MNRQQELEGMGKADINLLVAKIMFKNIDYEEILTYEGDYSGSAQIIAKTGFQGYIKDYCSNPSDIMPIIIEHKISLNWLGDLIGKWIAIEDSQDETSEDENPLRAACIVFILMMEGKG